MYKIYTIDYYTFQPVMELYTIYTILAQVIYVMK